MLVVLHRRTLLFVSRVCVVTLQKHKVRSIANTEPAATDEEIVAACF
jgi:hypothetical protein